MFLHSTKLNWDVLRKSLSSVKGYKVNFPVKEFWAPDMEINLEIIFASEHFLFYLELLGPVNN